VEVLRPGGTRKTAYLRENNYRGEILTNKKTEGKKERSQGRRGGAARMRSPARDSEADGKAPPWD